MTAQDTPQTFLDQAAHLREVLEETPEDFPKEAKALGISLRTAYYLVEVDRTFETLPVSRERLLKIGWTKLQLISAGLTEDDLEERLARAEAHTVQELRDLFEGDGDAPTKKRTVLLYLAPEEYAVYAEVLKAHGAKPSPRGLSGQEAALMTALKKLQTP